MDNNQTPVVSPTQVEQPSPYSPQVQPQNPAQNPASTPYPMQGQYVEQSPYSAQAQYQQQNMYQPQVLVPQGQQQAMAQQPEASQTDKKNAEFTPEDRATAKKLCIISLCCYCAPAVAYLISYLISMATDVAYLGSYGTIENAVSHVLEVITGISSIGVIAAYVLMIVARVKFPKSVFAKVLMWVYIGMFIMEVVSAILLIVFVWVACSACAGASCPG